jgi:pimeloyl-ACP methyl ester carboxylesterase
MKMKTGPKADKPAASRVTKIEGKKLHYLTAGQGPALILLHGYTQTSRMWRPLMDKLKDKFTVIAPDLPGIGDSDIPKDGCDMKTAAIRIHALAKSIGVTKARVVGHDIGLMVAYAYAAQFPTEVEKLVVMDAFLPGVQGWELAYNNDNLWHFRFHGPMPEALVEGREKIYFAYFWKDLAADKKCSLKPADRNAYVAAYSRSGPHACRLGLLCRMAGHGRGFRTNGQNKVDDARSVHRWRKSQRRNSSPADEACGDYRHRDRLERHRALAHGRAP